MKSRSLALGTEEIAPSALPRRTDSGVRLAIGPTRALKQSFLDDFGDEPTPVESVSVHLVAATAARDDDLDEFPCDDDEPPTCATPIDLAAMLSILSANGIPSPLGDAPLAPLTWTLPLGARTPLGSTLPMGISTPRLPLPSPHGSHARCEIYASPTIHFTQSPDAAAPPRRPEPRLLLVALITFITTLAATVGLAWTFAAPLLRR